MYFLEAWWNRAYFVLFMHCIVLHIVIYLYWTNSKKTQKSCVCFNIQKHEQTLFLTLYASQWNFYIQDFWIKVTLNGESSSMPVSWLKLPHWEPSPRKISIIENHPTRGHYSIEKSIPHTDHSVTHNTMCTVHFGVYLHPLKIVTVITYLI